MFGRKKPQQKRIVKKVFNGAVRCKDKNKVLMNNLVAQYCKEAGVTNKYALILESSEMLTTKTLVKAGFAKTKIEIPNPHEDFPAIKRKHRQTYKLLLGEYLDELRSVTDIRRSFGLAWFDYCDSYHGKKKAEYTKEDDIKKYFALKLPAKGSIFAITISYRATKAGIYSDLTACDIAITTHAQKNGYNACKIDGRAYNGLFVLFYKIY